jgi:endonuclease/exonuclease/phosphatase family metal-dependent hydrolase
VLMQKQRDFVGAAGSQVEHANGDVYAGSDLLTVGSYNDHRCIGNDLRNDVERVARVTLELKCDTVGLQEVDSRGALLALEVHRSADARAASDHAPVKAIVAPDLGRRVHRSVG